MTTPRLFLGIFALTLLLPLLLLACSGSPPPDPTATEATTQPPTTTQPPDLVPDPTDTHTDVESVADPSHAAGTAGDHSDASTAAYAPSHLSDSPAPISDAGATADDTALSAPDPRAAASADTDALGVANT